MQDATGSVSFEFVDNGGSGTTFLGSATWTKGWTSFSPFSVNGTGHVLVYWVGTGDAKVVCLRGRHRARTRSEARSGPCAVLTRASGVAHEQALDHEGRRAFVIFAISVISVISVAPVISVISVAPVISVISVAPVISVISVAPVISVISVAQLAAKQ